MKFLNGTRFDEQANDVFKMDGNLFQSIKDDPMLLAGQVSKYINTFKVKQLPRLKELKRYYKGDNNIKYRETGRDKQRADNRISSDWGKYITVFMQGMILGNPIQYQNENESLMERLARFSTMNNEDYLNALLETDLSIYGRAYELLYTDAEGDERSVKIDPEQSFVVYDNTVAQNSLFGVRFYRANTEESTYVGYVEIYTDEFIYYYSGTNSFNNLSSTEVEQHYYKAVPINEYQNNEERMGDYESVLDSIDAYDLSQSESANFQQDSADAYLVITGNPVTGAEDPVTVIDEFGEEVSTANSEAGVISKMLKARILVLDNNNDPDGPTPKAEYLKKEYDTAGAEAYKQRLVDDILRFTFAPDTNDTNFSGTQSGESMKYKLMGNDNLSKTKQRLLTKGFMRRLRLLSNIWSTKNSLSLDSSSDQYQIINDTVIKFTPNIPQNDEERIEMLNKLFGVVSDETLFTLLETFTGVDAKDEMNRLKIQKVNEADAFIKQSNNYSSLPIRQERQMND